VASFYNDVWYLRQIQEHQKVHAPSDTRASFGATETEQWQKIESGRKDLGDRISEISDRVQHELDGSATTPRG